MDKDLQYRAMEKLLNSLVKPEYEKIIDEIKVVPSTKMSKNTPTVKVYLSSTLLQNVTVKDSSGLVWEDIRDLTDNIDWNITEALKFLGNPRYWVEFIQIQP